MKSLWLTVLFICNALASPAQLTPPTVLFSPHTPLLPRLTQLLHNAQKRVLVASYLITSAPLVRALIAAHQRGATVTVITDQQMTKNTRGRQVLRQLRAARVPLFVFAGGTPQMLLHHKYAVIDAVAWLGSANWTTAGMTRNVENVLITRNPSLVHRLATHITTLKKRISRSAATTSVHPQDTLFFIPDHRRQVQSHIRTDISAARKRIWIASFEQGKSALIPLLKAAHKRGLSVRIITDEHATTVPLPQHTHQYVVPHGCMHHKFALIDNTVWTGSMNWTRSGMTHHQESIIRLSDARIAQQYHAEFVRLWQRHAPYKQQAHQPTLQPDYEKHVK